MKTEALSDHELVERIRNETPLEQAVVDEYYRRCIPVYLEFIGLHWHTGFYAAERDEIGPADQETMNRHIADSIGLRETDRVLDVGCGVGGTTAFLAREYGCRIVGLTPVPAQRDMARHVARHGGVAELATFDLGHAGRLPYDDQAFDVVLFFESPCHFPDRTAFFHETFRVLKPGGRLAGEDWLAAEGAGRHRDETHLPAVCRDWAIPALGDGGEYLDGIRAAGFDGAACIDMREEMALTKGFAVTAGQQAELSRDIRICRQPILSLVLQGLASLGRAVDAGSFTIGRFHAHRPTRVNAGA